LFSKNPRVMGTGQRGAAVKMIGLKQVMQKGYGGGDLSGKLREGWGWHLVS